MCVLTPSSPLIDNSVAVLRGVSGADLVNDVGAFLLHALGALLLVDQVQDLGTDLLRHVPADLRGEGWSSHDVSLLSLTFSNVAEHRLSVTVSHFSS